MKKVNKLRKHVNSKITNSVEINYRICKLYFFQARKCPQFCLFYLKNRDFWSIVTYHNFTTVSFSAGKKEDPQNASCHNFQLKVRLLDKYEPRFRATHLKIFENLNFAFRLFFRNDFDPNLGGIFRGSF